MQGDDSLAARVVLVPQKVMTSFNADDEKPLLVAGRRALGVPLPPEAGSHAPELDRHQFLDRSLWCRIGRRQSPALLLIHFDTELDRLSRSRPRFFEGRAKSDDLRKRRTTHRVATLWFGPEGANILCVGNTDGFLTSFCHGR